MVDRGRTIHFVEKNAMSSRLELQIRDTGTVQRTGPRPCAREPFEEGQLARGWLFLGPFGSPETSPLCHHQGSDATFVQGLGRKPAECLSAGHVQIQKRDKHQWPHRCRSQGRTPRAVHGCAAAFAPWLYPLNESFARPPVVACQPRRLLAEHVRAPPGYAPRTPRSLTTGGQPQPA